VGFRVWYCLSSLVQLVMGFGKASYLSSLVQLIMGLGKGIRAAPIRDGPETPGFRGASWRRGLCRQTGMNTQHRLGVGARIGQPSHYQAGPTAPGVGVEQESVYRSIPTAPGVDVE
jgi:hypothetical protein